MDLPAESWYSKRKAPCCERLNSLSLVFFHAFDHCFNVFVTRSSHMQSGKSGCSACSVLSGLLANVMLK